MNQQDKKLITVLYMLIPHAYANQFFDMITNDNITVQQIETRLKEIFPPESERE